jgi:hypothetical protein
MHYFFLFFFFNFNLDHLITFVKEENQFQNKTVSFASTASNMENFLLAKKTSQESHVRMVLVVYALATVNLEQNVYSLIQMEKSNIVA